MTKIAFLFPGQGAQYVGMGRELYDRYPAARAAFEETACVLGEDLTRIIFDGPEEELQETINTQPAILATSIAAYKTLIDLGIRPQAVAGLSLGEYGALVAAGVLSFERALPLVQKRGSFMQEAVPLGQGSMAAVMGLSTPQVEEVCLAACEEGIVAPANYNCPGQIVISGQSKAVKKALLGAREAGAKKVVELRVSAPFHCSLLAPVEDKMAALLDQEELNSPQVPVVFNISAAYEKDPAKIKTALIKQVSSPILWEQSMRKLLQDGFDCFIEMSPGNTLTRLMKKIAGSSAVYASVDDCRSMEDIAQLCHKEG